MMENAKAGGLAQITSSLTLPIMMVLLVAAGFALRAYGANFGLPYLLHPDEHYILNMARKIFQTKNLYDPYPMYGSFASYIYTALYAVLFLPAPSQAFLNAPVETVCLVGRLITAGIGALSILVAYLIGREFFNRETGFLGAIFLTFTFLHVQMSHYLKPDVLQTLMLMLTILGAYRILKRQTVASYSIAGLLAGATTAIKFSFLAFIPAVVAHLLSYFETRKFLLKGFLLLSLAVGVGFTLSSPYWPVSLRAYAAILQHYFSVSTVEAYAGNEGQYNWFWYLSSIVSSGGMGRAIGLLALGGVAYACLRPTRKDLFLLSLPLIWLLFFGSFRIRQARYMLPIMPFLALYAAHFLLLIISWIGIKVEFVRTRCSLVVSILVLLVIISPLSLILKWDYYLSQPDTRIVAVEWIKGNLPLGSRIGNEVVSLPLISDRFVVVDYVNSGLCAHDLDWYRDQGYDYLIASSSAYAPILAEPEKYAVEAHRYQEIFQKASLVKRFENSAFNASFTYDKLGWENAASANHNPEILVYRCARGDAQIQWKRDQ